MVDIEGNSGIIWEHEFYEDFEYNPDRAFFHTFAGDVSLHRPVFTRLYVLIAPKPISHA